MNETSTFRSRVLAGEHLVGTFIKTPADAPVEIIGGHGFDFVVIDAEHAPFDRGAIDRAILVAHATGAAALVRLHSATAPDILSALDSGADGLLVPHVASSARARDIVRACRYRNGSRGFSGSPRAGLYGRRALSDLVSFADRNVTIVAQIEDPEALDVVDEIAAVDGIDALFVGRGDLTVAMGATSGDAPEIVAASRRVAAAAQRARKPFSVFCANPRDGANMAALGASLFIAASDQSFLSDAAKATLAAFRNFTPAQPAGPAL